MRGLRAVALLVVATGVSVLAEGVAAQEQRSPFEPFRNDIATIVGGSSEKEDGLRFIGLGIPAPDASDFEDVGKAKAFGSALFDQVPPATVLTSSLDVYRQTLEYSEVAEAASTPDPRRDREWKQVLLKRRTLLDLLLWRHRERRQSRTWLAYDRYALEHAAAVEEDRKVGSEETKAKVEATKQNWEVLGYREAVDAALERHRESLPVDPAVWWSGLRARFSTFDEQLENDPSLLGRVSIRPEDWKDDAGWLSLAVSRPADGELAVELKRVTIERPWLSEEVFRSSKWRWRRSGNEDTKDPISTGSPQPVLGEQLPYLSTGLLLARKGHIRTPEGLDIRIEEPQVIGWFSRRVPKSPSPDPAARWPGDPDDRVLTPLSVSVGACVALSYDIEDAEGSSNGLRGQIGPVPCLVVGRRQSLAIVAGPGWGTRLRGTGLMIGVSTRPSHRVPVSVFGGIRFGSAGEPARVVIGLQTEGFRIPSLSGDAAR